MYRVRKMRSVCSLAVLLVIAGLCVAGPSHAQSSPYLGEIRMFAGTFAPAGWAFCQGQLLPINQNQALFAIIGTTYGGDGQTTFALPDLRGRFPVGFGQGSGLHSRAIGEVGGAEAVALTAAEMPAHTHTARAQSGLATSLSPGGRVPAAGTKVYSGATPNTSLSRYFLLPTGGGKAHHNMPPYLGVNFIIALQGIFPTQN